MRDAYVRLADVYEKIAHVEDMNIKEPLSVLRRKIGDIPTIRGESMSVAAKVDGREIKLFMVTIAAGVQQNEDYYKSKEKENE